MRILVPALTLTLACLHLAASAQTRDSEQPAPAASDPSGSLWRVMVSPYTYHYSHDPEHRPVRMLGLERQRSDGFVWGATYFTNSFGQPSAYVFAGDRLENFTSQPQLFATWTAGVLYGYKGEFKDKVPFNHGGFSPGAVLSLGWQFTPIYSAQVNVLGNSALMFQFSAELH